jgi:hypothetical protein
MFGDPVQILLDKQDLHELVLTYCRAVDRRDYALLRSLYHDDAIDDHGAMFKGGPDDYVAWLPGAMAMWETTVHSLSNCLFKIDGDAAEGELYAIAYHRSPPPDAREIVIGGRYLDRYERRDGVWKFHRRALALDWCNVRDVNPADYETFAAGAVIGRPDAGDASYVALGMFGRDQA